MGKKLHYLLLLIKVLLVYIYYNSQKYSSINASTYWPYKNYFKVGNYCIIGAQIYQTIIIFSQS